MKRVIPSRIWNFDRVFPPTRWSKRGETSRNGTVSTRGTTFVLKASRSEVILEVYWCGEDGGGIWTKMELCSLLMNLSGIEVEGERVIRGSIRWISEAIRRHLLSHKRGLKEEGRGTWSRHVRACAVHVAPGPFGLGLAGLAHWLAWPVGPLLFFLFFYFLFPSYLLI
jgi:hypothetical protein